MAEIKPQVYKDTRPADYFEPFHTWARTHGAGWTYELVRMIITPVAMLLYRCRAIGVDNVPADGGFIMAPNHFSNMDHFFAGVYTRRKIRFMAKSQLFGKNRLLTYVFRAGGVFPVRRGHHDDEAFATAHGILDRGDCVLIYAEGGRSRTGALGDPRPGVGRLALESGLPVVPVAIHGSLGVRRWKRLQFPKVTVQYAEPMRFDVVAQPTREQQLEAARAIFDRVKAMYEPLDAKGRRGVLRSLREGAADAVAGASAGARPRTHS
ncbi:MAG: lysophospholipid acyltransferase family protein [Solirubrobacterales bacterium]